MVPKIVSYVAVTALFLAAWLPAVGLDKSARENAVVHAVGGVVTRIDSAAKTIALKMADGTEQVFRYTAKTAMHASRQAGRDAERASVETYIAGKEGTHVIVHYTGEGTDRTAVAVDDFGKNGLKFSQGTVTYVDKATRAITIKSEDGTEETYHVAKDATIDTEHGVVEGSELAAKDGEKVTVNYSEDAGKKLAHLIRHI